MAPAEEPPVGASSESFELLINTAPTKTAKTKEEVQKARALFNKFDADGSGTIDRLELANALKEARGIAVSSSSVLALLNNFDADGDGVLDFDEFQLLSDKFSGFHDGTSCDPGLVHTSFGPGPLGLQLEANAHGLIVVGTSGVAGDLEIVENGDLLVQINGEPVQLDGSAENMLDNFYATLLSLPRPLILSFKKMQLLYPSYEELYKESNKLYTEEGRSARLEETLGWKPTYEMKLDGEEDTPRKSSGFFEFLGFGGEAAAAAPPPGGPPGKSPEEQAIDFVEAVYACNLETVAAMLRESPALTRALAPAPPHAQPDGADEKSWRKAINNWELKFGKGSIEVSPLYAAARRGWAEGAALLLDLGAQADVGARNAFPKYESPLRAALAGGHVEVAKLLLVRGASPITSK